jgi:hypothetical protein
MKKTFETLIISSAIALWWQEALASNEPIELWKPTVWHTTEKVKNSTNLCLDIWAKNNPNDDCVIMTKLVSQSDIDSFIQKTVSTIEQKTIQNTENWKQMHQSDLIKFWWGVISIIGAISLLIWKDTIFDKLQTKKIKKLKEELKVKVNDLYYVYPNWFISIKNDAIDQILKEWQICYEDLPYEWIYSKNHKKDTIQKLQELKGFIHTIDTEFKLLNSIYQDNIDRLETLYNTTLFLIKKSNERWDYSRYSEENIIPTYKYNTIIKEIYDLQKIFDELNEKESFDYEENNK